MGVGLKGVWEMGRGWGWRGGRNVMGGFVIIIY